MALSSSDLEALADSLLNDVFTEPRRNKTRSAEFPILSPSQIKRRCSMEIPYSNLSERQRLECRMKNLDYYSREGD